jgi:hypothetical protein
MNTLAYLASSSATKEKSIITLAPGRHNPEPWTPEGARDVSCLILSVESSRPAPALLLRS